MGLGTQIRLARLFSHPSGHVFGGAVDHFVGYGNVREGGLADLPGALARVMAGQPDYVSIQPGAARHLWPAYAGKAALAIQAGCFTADDRISQLIATPEDAVRYGADARAFLDAPGHAALRLRGVLCSVERDGEVTLRDRLQVLRTA